MIDEPHNNTTVNKRRFQLDRVAFYGRTLSEYLKMFNINSIEHLKAYDTILDCPAGASSFVAEACNKYGINAIGCDPMFDQDSKALKRVGENDIEYVTRRVSTAANLYNWDFYTSLKDLRRFRSLALEMFLSDYNESVKRKRYIKAMLPALPFENGSFDLVLSGHFLFTYSHRFDFSFISSSIIDLLRVCTKEVRIYPIQKASSEPYEHMPDLLSILDQHGAVCEIVPVIFEFQKGSNKMLVLRHKH
jgi:hypothetical protein